MTLISDILFIFLFWAFYRLGTWMDVKKPFVLNTKPNLHAAPFCYRSMLISFVWSYLTEFESVNQNNLLLLYYICQYVYCLVYCILFVLSAVVLILLSVVHRFAKFFFWPPSTLQDINLFSGQRKKFWYFSDIFVEMYFSPILLQPRKLHWFIWKYLFTNQELGI